MKIQVVFPMRWLPLTKAGLAVAAVCLAGQVLAQPAPSVPANGGSAANPVLPANAKDDRAKRIDHEVSRAPVKPQHYPSTPQPPVPKQR
jgi:hypothetical protein